MDDSALMRRAIEAAASVRASTSPNPWVGAALRTVDGTVFVGATEPPGGRHAERVALDAAAAAGADVAGSTLAVTLEPCCHTGRTGPCTTALLAAGVGRVLVGVDDPDPRVSGRGLEALAAGGVEVSCGVCDDEISEQLAPYLHHRRTGRPWVVLKLASTLDGRLAAPDGTSKWITGELARADVHRLRAISDAVLVGAGTVRHDDPELTVRLVEGRDPRRVVLGAAPTGARVHPCTEWSGPVEGLLDVLGREGVVQVLVEGGAHVAGAMLRAGLVQQVLLYLAPAFFGGDDALPMLAGPSVPTIAALRRGRLVSVDRLGDDLRLDIRSLQQEDH
ncbi:MAG: bifunctional diaminohydroxyphosphoribosylaminopyrimidine deaminase/5-amino-6-(5-phosphoribosylamino)uracil reductase RibD [Ilumatobacteraceae bacterium]